MSAPATTAPSSDRIQVLALSLLRESPTNPRKSFDPKALKDLAESIQSHGILQPILARPAGTGYEIVAGARRFRAAQQAPLTEVPVIVRAMSDSEVMEAQVIENLQRQDVHPLDEADGYQAMVTQLGYSADDIAAKVGKSVPYIRQRMELTKLNTKAKKAFLEGQLVLGHALLLAPLNPKIQDELIKECGEPLWHKNKNLGTTICSVREMRARIEEHYHRDLKAAPWTLDDASLVPEAGPCSMCPKRTDLNSDLFSEFPKKASCTDAACFKGKALAYSQRFIASAKADGIQTRFISESYYRDRDVPKDTLLTSEYKVIKQAKECEFGCQGIFHHGRRLGQIVAICAEPKKCRTHQETATARLATAMKTPAQKAQAKRELLKKRIEQTSRERTWERSVVAIEKFNDDTLRYIAGRILSRWWHEHRKQFCKLTCRESLATHKGKGQSIDYDKILRQRLAECRGTSLVQFIVGLVTISDLPRPYYERDGDELMRFAKLAGVNPKAIEKTVARELSQPRQDAKALSKTPRGSKAA